MKATPLAGDMPIDAVTLRRLEAGKAEGTAEQGVGVVETQRIDALLCGLQAVSVQIER